jgi:hypothetical protein
MWLTATFQILHLQRKASLAESGPSLQVQSLTSIQEEADLQHKTHLRGAAKVFKEPNVTDAALWMNVCCTANAWVGKIARLPPVCYTDKVVVLAPGTAHFSGVVSWWTYRSSKLK